MVAPERFQPRMRHFSGAALERLPFAWIAACVHRGRLGREANCVVIGRDGNNGVTRLQNRIHRRVHLCGAVCAAQSQHSGIFVSQQRVAVGLARQRGFLLEVNLVAAEIHQFGVNNRKSGLTRSLRHDARDQFIRQHRLNHVALSDHLNHIHVLWVADLRHNVIRLGAAVWAVGQRQHRFDDVRVGVTALGQNDDRARRVRADDLDVGQVNRTARTTDDARVLRVGDAFADRIFHLDLVLVCHHDDGRAALAISVCDHQFRDDGEHLRSPAEDDGVIVFEHERASLAETFDLRFESAREDADQRADDEDAADGDQQHDEAEAPARVAAHRARVERAHETEPGGLEKVGRVRTFGREQTSTDGDDQRGNGDDDERDERQSADQRGRATRHDIVKPVSKALTKRIFLRHDNSPGISEGHPIIAFLSPKCPVDLCRVFVYSVAD